MQEPKIIRSKFWNERGPQTLVLFAGVIALIAGGIYVVSGSAFNNSARPGDTVAVELQENDNVASVAGLDSDDDGLTDLQEKRYHTDPNNPDTDGDGYSDGVEVEKGFDPNSPLGETSIVSSDGSGGTSSNLLSALGVSALDQPVDGLDVGGLGGLPTGDTEQLQNGVLPNGDRIADLEVDNILNVTSQALPSVDTSKFDVTGNSSRARKEQYVRDVVSIVFTESNFPEGYRLNDLLKDIETNNRDMFESMKLSSELMLKRLRDLEVPEAMVPYHAHAIGIAQTSRDTLQRTLDSGGSPDDILFLMGRTFFVMGEIQALLQTGLQELQS